MSGYAGANVVIWQGFDGRTHAAIESRSYTVCLLDTGNLLGVQEGDPLIDGVSCEKCSSKLRDAIQGLLGAMERVSL